MEEGRSAKEGEFWLRCGECKHFVKRDSTFYWCGNKFCRQFTEPISMSRTVVANQFVERAQA